MASAKDIDLGSPNADQNLLTRSAFYSQSNSRQRTSARTSSSCGDRNNAVLVAMGDRDGGARVAVSRSAAGPLRATGAGDRRDATLTIAHLGQEHAVAPYTWGSIRC